MKISVNNHIDILIFYTAICFRAEQIATMADGLSKEVESVRQIDENIAHVAEIVDSNSAASEETAAISEEQSAQIQTMVQMVEQFEI